MYLFLHQGAWGNLFKMQFSIWSLYVQSKLFSLDLDRVNPIRFLLPSGDPLERFSFTFCPVPGRKRGELSNSNIVRNKNVVLEPLTNVNFLLCSCCRFFFSLPVPWSLSAEQEMRAMNRVPGTSKNLRGVIILSLSILKLKNSFCPDINFNKSELGLTES